MQSITPTFKLSTYKNNVLQYILLVKKSAILMLFFIASISPLFASNPQALNHPNIRRLTHATIS